MKPSVPSLGFEHEMWYGDGLLEVTLGPAVKCFVERTLTHLEAKAKGRPWCVFFHDYRRGYISRIEYVEDFFEAKMLIQSVLNEVENDHLTFRGNHARSQTVPEGGLPD